MEQAKFQSGKSFMVQDKYSTLPNILRMDIKEKTTDMKFIGICSL